MKKLIVMLGMFLALSAFANSAAGKEKHKMVNRLKDAQSPYLRQHANNPVDWYSWGKEAFDRARTENKPIFLSVGYSTCHWCHVMERESFENEGLARILNKYFIAIKVDRERRPDVDETYMIATQIITRQGGWPNSLFLTPELKPFYAGTYFPREDFARILTAIAGQWQKNEKALRADGDHISDVIIQILNRKVASRSITSKSLHAAGKDIMRDADSFNGGFDTAPKFPNEPTLMFLLQLAASQKDEKALAVVTNTIDAMLDGGIHDHVGGGFHRYAVDNEWRIPHFEKMLYNQAQMIRVLVKTYRLTGKKRYARAAERTISYVKRHMTSPQGGFYSAWDADSEGEEGTFYVWTPKQLVEVLGPKDGALAATMFGVTPEGNFEGSSVLHFSSAPRALAAKLKMSTGQFETRLALYRQKLEAAREKRQHPHLDDKIVLSWNGMMIAALAEASIMLDNREYALMAQKALAFIDSHMTNKDGSYLRSHFKGRTELDAQQEDYAWLALAFVLSYDATDNKDYLQKARAVSNSMIQRYLDEKTGDFFMVEISDTFTRGKTRSDSATPSGNSVALEVFAMLAVRDQDQDIRSQADRLLLALSGHALEQPRSAAYTLRAADMISSGEQGDLKYMANGFVRAKARFDKQNQEVIVFVKIAPGWHINGNRPLQNDVLPTVLLVTSKNASTGEVKYPATVKRKLEFSKDELALYEGSIEIRAPVKQKSAAPIDLVLSLQACSSKICLAPEKVEIEVR